MHTRHLIDAIVRQTTVLIAQLSTTAGIRAPLAKVADQVFLELSREIESQGVGKKVVADMFGLALRSYQIKVSRLGQCATNRDTTLWEAVLLHIRDCEMASRREIADRFRHDNPNDLAAVLNDLVGSGLVYSTGRGRNALYRVADEHDYASMIHHNESETVTNLVWLKVYDERSIARTELVKRLPFKGDLIEAAINTLINDGRIENVISDGIETLECTELSIPVGSEQGWEAAVFDHFRAVTTAIASKLRATNLRSQKEDLIGGTTLTFSIYPGHPLEDQVYGLLQKTRNEANDLWSKVTKISQEHKVDQDKITDVTFYFGQNVTEPNDR